MVEEIKKTDSNTKTQLSLAAALFFSPLVQYVLKKNERDLWETEKQFVRGYIKFGYLTLAFGVLVIFAGIMNYLLVMDIWNVIYTVSIFILLFLLLISVVSILSDISLLKSGNNEMTMYNVNGSRKDILLKYLPLYNIYLWYQVHSFERPNRWIKESILMRTIFLLISIFWSIRWSTIVLIIIIIRIASLMSDIDILHTQRKKQLNVLFLKNPEEIRWYISGFVRYLAKWFAHLFTPMLPYTLNQEIEKEKELYSHIIHIRTHISLILEYMLWILLLWWMTYIVSLSTTTRPYYSALWLLILRYLVMGIQLQYLPHLPLARELVLLGTWIGWSIKKLFSKHR